MLTAEQGEPLFSFPKVADEVKARYSISDLALRPFGLYESDLSVDFSHTPRPFLVTQILECCTRDVQGAKIATSFFWDLTVGKRTECLLNLASAAGLPEVAVTLSCPDR